MSFACNVAAPMIVLTVSCACIVDSLVVILAVMARAVVFILVLLTLLRTLRYQVIGFAGNLDNKSIL